MNILPIEAKSFIRTLSDGHVSDDPLDGIFPFVTILTVEVGAKLKVLACTTMSGTTSNTRNIRTFLWCRPGKNVHVGRSGRIKRKRVLSLVQIESHRTRSCYVM